VSIPTPDPIVTTVLPDTESKRAEKREAHLDASQSQQEILDDIYRYRGQLQDSIDQLHTRLSPKYHIDQLKDEFKLAGTDALAIVKGEGKPVDESRAKNAEALVKAGGGLASLIAFRTLRKFAKEQRLHREIRRAVRRGEAREKFEIHGLVEEGIDEP